MGEVHVAGQLANNILGKGKGRLHMALYVLCLSSFVVDQISVEFADMSISIKFSRTQQTRTSFIIPISSWNVYVVKE